MAGQLSPALPVRVFTIDCDFQIDRRLGRKVMPVIGPKRGADALHGGDAVAAEAHHRGG
jgi:hypothetical protein